MPHLVLRKGQLWWCCSAFRCQLVSFLSCTLIDWLRSHRSALSRRRCSVQQRPPSCGRTVAVERVESRWPHGTRADLDNPRKMPFFRFKQQEDGARALLIRRNYQTAPQAWTEGTDVLFFFRVPPLVPGGFPSLLQRVGEE